MNLVNPALRRAALALSIAAAALVAACGGGTQVEKFEPARILALGDENSVLEDSGDHNARKYTVNHFTAATPPVRDCRTWTIWVQYLAVSLGRIFPQCNYGTGAVADPPSRIYAQPGATVAGIDAQIAAHGGLARFGDSDLVTVFVGANDVFELFAQLDALGREGVIEEAEARGDALAAKINSIVDTGARALVLLVPDQGLTPEAIAAETARAGSQQLLTDLSKRFNARLRFSIIQDGHRIGLYAANDLVLSLVQNVGFNTLANVNAAVCDPAKAPDVRDCTNNTLVTDGNATTWLWADARHLSPAGHSLLGQGALAQFYRNPF